jgi:MerR family redox-sensitive transcriptional activator SoxR
MTIGEVAKRSGLRASAIRYYERVGLLPKQARSGGQRRYDSRILARLAVLERAKNCGFTLDEVRHLFNDQGRPSERWDRAAKTKIVELDALMERIRGMRDLIVRRCQCEDLDECGRKLMARKPEACATSELRNRQPGDARRWRDRVCRPDTASSPSRESAALPATRDRRHHS